MALDQSALTDLLDALRAGGDLDFMREAMQLVLQALIDLEATQVIGTARYERTDNRTTHRNGSRSRLLSTKAGDVELAIPKLRHGSFFPALLEPRRRVDRALWAVIMEAFVHGVSTRKVDDLVAALGIDAGVSKSQVSRICAELDGAVAEFRGGAWTTSTSPMSSSTPPTSRPMTGPGWCPRPSSWPPAWLPTATGRCWAWPSATARTRRSGRRSCAPCEPEGWPVCAWSSPTLTRACAPPSSGSCWGPPGSVAGSTSCENVLARVPRGSQEMVAAAIRTVFAQPDAAAVADQLDSIAGKLGRQFPAVETMLREAAIDVCAFAAFPSAHWKKVWSTNPLERVNKEIKRRTNVVGIFPNEASVLRLARSILLEVHDEWQIAERRYLSEASMAKLYENDNDGADTKEVGTNTKELLAG